MYAIVDIAGQQFKVTKDQEIFVHRLDGEKEDKIEFDKVLLIDNDDKVEIGEPVIKGALIKGKILEHLKGDTVKVFKKKRRKGYKVLNGHRQHLSHVLIEEIIEKGATKSVVKKETTKPAQTQKAPPKAKKAIPKAEKAIPKAEKAIPKAEKAIQKDLSTKKTVVKTSEAKAKAATTKAVKSKPATKKPAAKKTKPKAETKTSTKKATKKTTASKKTKE